MGLHMVMCLWWVELIGQACMHFVEELGVLRLIPGVLPFVFLLLFR